MDASQDTVALLYFMKSIRMKQDHSSQLVIELPSHCTRAAGILKYMRESVDCELTFDTKTEGPSDYQIKCEYCGQELSPLLEETGMYGSKAELVFCCDQWRQLYRLLLNMRNMWEGKSADDNNENRDLVYRRKKDKFSMFLESTKDDKSDPRQFDDYLIEMPVLNNVAPGSNVINFRLSCPEEGSWVKFPESKSERSTIVLEAKVNYNEIFVSICDHKPLDFGLCYHREGDIVTRYYADGQKFLLVLDNGSAQVFYPSGLLAILLTVTKPYGRDCIVYDNVPGQPMRALFQSDGKGTCYHTNGNIWLIINKYGGQCLDPDGARVCRWTWYKLRSAPLRPIFLCINKNIGVRVLGKQRVFVSFLANGKQAKFNVGAWCCKNNCKEVLSPPTFARENIISIQN